MPLIKLLKEAEAAEFLNVQPQTMRNWRCVGEGPPHIRLGRRAIRYLAEDLQKWAIAQRVNPKHGD